MKKLFASLTVTILLSGCAQFMPVTAEEAKGQDGMFSHRTDLGGYYRLDNGGVGVVRPQSWRR
jgi:uncharacterized protein YceK